MNNEQDIKFSDNELVIKDTHKSSRLSISFDADYGFFAITPCFNINRHSKTFEIEWLFWAIYIDINS